MHLLKAIAVATIGAALLLQDAFGSCGSSPFEDQVRRAQLIFAGTVTQAVCERIPGTIITRYRFDNVRYVKGSGPADSLVLVEAGGIVDGVRMHSTGSTSYRVGTRYVVFATRFYRLPREYTTSSCGTGHPFGIWPDSGSQTAVVHSGANAVVAFDDRHLVRLGTHPWRAGASSADYDRKYEIARQPPPRRPLPELLSLADSAFYARLRESVPDSARHVVAGRLRTIFLWPHQDPGDRVTEDDLMRVLSGFVSRTSGPNSGLPPASVHGRVLNRGKPVPNARVNASGADGWDWCATDTLGVCELLLPIGAYRFSVTPAERWFSPVDFPADSVVEPRSMDFEIDGVQWTGIVKMAGSGTPVDSIEIIAYAQPERISSAGLYCSSGPGGRFHLVLRPGQSYELHLRDYRVGPVPGSNITAPSPRSRTEAWLPVTSPSMTGKVTAPGRTNMIISRSGSRGSAATDAAQIARAMHGNCTTARRNTEPSSLLLPVELEPSRPQGLGFKVSCLLSSVLGLTVHSVPLM